MTNQIGIVATVNIGTVQVEGVMLPDGRFALLLQDLGNILFPDLTIFQSLHKLETICKELNIPIIQSLIENREKPERLVSIDNALDILRYLMNKKNKCAEEFMCDILGVDKSFLKEGKKESKSLSKKSEYIYLLEGKDILKLGYSTNVGRRIKDLSRWEGEFKLVTTVKGDVQKEKYFHRLLHNTGEFSGEEWYPLHRKQEILDLIQNKQ